VRTVQATHQYIKHLLKHGFVVLSKEDAEAFLNVLREKGAIHMVHVGRLSRYIVIELNKLPCIRECDSKCRDIASGKKLVGCESRCIDQCLVERINAFASRVLSR